MPDGISSKPTRPRYRFILFMGLFYLGVAGMNYMSYGVAADVAFLIGLGLIFVVATLLGVDLEKEDWWAEVPYQRWLLVLGALAIGASVYFLGGVTVNGRPVFAGPMVLTCGCRPVRLPAE